MKPMNRKEWQEFANATLHGKPPQETLNRIYATVDREFAINDGLAEQAVDADDALVLVNKQLTEERERRFSLEHRFDHRITGDDVIDKARASMGERVGETPHEKEMRELMISLIGILDTREAQANFESKSSSKVTVIAVGKYDSEDTEMVEDLGFDDGQPYAILIGDVKEIRNLASAFGEECVVVIKKKEAA